MEVPNLRIEELDEPRSFRVTGELALASATNLVDLLTETCRTGGDVALDLEGVTFMDSSGLSAVIEACDLLGSQGRLTLVNPSPQVQRILRLTDLERLPNLEVVNRSES